MHPDQLRHLSYIMEHDEADWDVVKCVVVGDSGIGKTRLTCARACGTKYSLSQLMQTHHPTVWAIDHYRQDKQVLEKSHCVIDGVKISLRIWDTFGYHDKNRMFAYGRADVILICFSVVKPQSLANVMDVWYAETKKYCPNIPIILCGLQTDLRYLYHQEDFLKLDKGIFYKTITSKHIIDPERGREAANKIGAYYYETSVFTQYGVEEMFENACRAALVGRRQRKIFTYQLKNVSKPKAVAPFLPPKPAQPEIIIPQSELRSNLSDLLENQSLCDVILETQGVCVEAHTICLIAASSVFYDVLTMDLASLEASKKEAETGKKSHFSLGVEFSDTDGLVPNILTASSLTLDSVSSFTGLPTQVLNHPAFVCLQLKDCDDPYNPGTKVQKIVLTLDSTITPKALQYIVHYLYTGKAKEDYKILEDVRTAAKLLELPYLCAMVTNLLNSESYLNNALEMEFNEKLCARIKDLVLTKGVCPDIEFQLDDGNIPAHKALLMSRCDVMLAMFSDAFMESSAKTVSFPGVTCATFQALQFYLYTGQTPPLRNVDCLDLIELANRLCLPQLVAMVEKQQVKELSAAIDSGEDVTSKVLYLVEIAQLYNANQLAQWCIWYLATNMGTIFKRTTVKKQYENLNSGNKENILKYKWPPLWYLKEERYYEKALFEEDKQKKLIGQPEKRPCSSNSNQGGCLCFVRKARKNTPLSDT